MGRRVQKLVYAYGSGEWQLEKEILFVYDGWNLIEEITFVGATETSRYFVWGLDVSNSLQGAGGIGGLLAMVDNGNTYHYFYDANGNASQLVNAANGEIAAHYEFDPFGNTVYQSGAMADDNPFRHATQYFDDETELYSYIFRYYSPELGRWLNRDPQGELGGFNLYCFVLNNVINAIDPLGLMEDLNPLHPDPSQYSSCTRCHYETYLQDLKALSWRIIWLFERGGKYRELYNKEAAPLNKLKGRIPKAKLESMRGALKSKYQAITPPEIESGLKAILGNKKYEARKPTGGFNPGKTNEAVNKTFKGMKWAGRVMLVVSLYGEYQAISNADDWNRQLGSSSSGILGSIGGGAATAAGARLLLAIPQVGKLVPHPYVKFAIVAGSSVVGAYAGYEFSSGTFEHIYDIYVCEPDNETN